MTRQIKARSPRGEASERLFDAEHSASESIPPSFLSDESRIHGTAERLFFPRTESGVSAILCEARRLRIPVTVSAGRTGVVGGAVPHGGWILSTERMASVEDFQFDDATGEYRLLVGPGVVLENLRRAIRSVFFPFSGPVGKDTQQRLEEFRSQSTRWIFAPDPTERTAQIGGMAASNASGARTFRYGATREHLRGLTVVLPNGEVLDLRRGECVVAPGEKIEITSTHQPPIILIAPTYAIPDGKHACGFYSGPRFDLIDLFIGSEGTLGVITGLELALSKVPGQEAELVAFFPEMRMACRFVELLRQHRRSESIEIEAIEYLCEASLTLLAEHRLHPRFPAGRAVAVCIGARIVGQIGSALEMINGLIARAGGVGGEALAALNSVDIARVAHFRHALPETVNALIAQVRSEYPGLTKLGTDMAVPDESLEAVLELYSRRLTETGLRHVMFGHIGNNHLHVNILPRNPDEYARGKELYQEFAAWVVRAGGSVSAEHGIGKLKKYLMGIQFQATPLAEMKALKTALDPLWLLNRGNLFDPEI